MPTSDVLETLNNSHTTKNGVDSILSKASQSIFSELLIAKTLPKDIADMHLAGEINISNTGLWALIPDTVFLDLAEFCEGGLNLRDKFLNVSRLPRLENNKDFRTIFPLLVSLLSREAPQNLYRGGYSHSTGANQRTGGSCFDLFEGAYSIFGNSLIFSVKVSDHYATHSC